MTASSIYLGVGLQPDEHSFHSYQAKEYKAVSCVAVLTSEVEAASDKHSKNEEGDA